MPEPPSSPERPELDALHIAVPRTARYYMVGAPNPLVRDVWVVCHGFSQLARAFVEPFRQLGDDHRLIVAPEALARFYLDSRPAHTRSSPVGATWMTREDREVEIRDIVTYLDALYERIVELLAGHDVARDRIRVHALGFSQGAAAVARWASRGSAVIDHLVLWGHGIPDDVNVRAVGEWLPDLTIDVIYGQRDRFANADAMAATRAVLEGSGVPFRMLPFEGGHVLSTPVLRELLAGG